MIIFDLVSNLKSNGFCFNLVRGEQWSWRRSKKVIQGEIAGQAPAPAQVPPIDLLRYSGSTNSSRWWSLESDDSAVFYMRKEEVLPVAQVPGAGPDQVFVIFTEVC